jgi:hypothetical protein
MTTSKYKIHKSCAVERRARETLDKLISAYGNMYKDTNTERFSIYKRTWQMKDKHRFIVRELIRKGSKR